MFESSKDDVSEPSFLVARLTVRMISSREPCFKLLLAFEFYIYCTILMDLYQMERRQPYASQDL